MDYTLDRIGERLDHPEREPELAADDLVRVTWILDHTPGIACLLDVGASDGAILRRWLERYPESSAVAVEPHPAHRSALADLPRTVVVPFRATEGLSLWRANQFSVAWLTEVLEHQETMAAYRMLEALTRVALHLIVTVPNRDCASTPEHRQRWQWPDHTQVFTARDLRAALESAGWTVTTLEPIVGESVDDSIWLGAICQRA
jgi:hypothetical protein